MYSMYDRQAAIREIKKYLFTVSRYVYTEIPKTTIDGFYDSETANAIGAFQAISELPITGSVDLRTFDALYALYNAAVTDFNTNDYIIEDRGFPVSPGDMNEDVRTVHLLINELADRFTELENVGTGNYYTNRTANAVRLLRHVFGFTDGETIDKGLYLRMIAELDAHRKNDKRNHLSD